MPVTDEQRDREPRRNGISVGRGIVVGIVVAVFVIAGLSAIFWVPWAARDGIEVENDDEDDLPPTVPGTYEPFDEDEAPGYVLI